MKASKFSDAQKAFIVKRGEEGVPVAEICREAGISVEDNGRNRLHSGQSQPQSNDSFLERRR